MPHYAIAIPSLRGRVIHRIVEGEGQEAALKKFFEDNMTSQYSKDDQGYFYFKEDFFDPEGPIGSILEVSPVDAEVEEEIKKEEIEKVE